MSRLDFRDGKGEPPPISINVSMTVTSYPCTRCSGTGKRWWLWKCKLCKGKGEWDLEHLTEAQHDALQADYRRQLAEWYSQGMKATDEYLNNRKEAG